MKLIGWNNIWQSCFYLFLMRVICVCTRVRQFRRFSNFTLALYTNKIQKTKRLYWLGTGGFSAATTWNSQIYIARTCASQQYQLYWRSPVSVGSLPSTFSKSRRIMTKCQIINLTRRASAWQIHRLCSLPLFDLTRVSERGKVEEKAPKYNIFRATCSSVPFWHDK